MVGLAFEGKSRTTIIIAINAIAIDEMTGLSAPRWKGPGVNFWPPMWRAAIGMEYAVYVQTTPIVKIAVMAAGPAKDSRPSSRAPVAQKMTEMTGVCVYELRLYNHLDNGRAPSREKANIWREVATSTFILDMLIVMMIKLQMAKVPRSPRLLKIIVAIGWPIGFSRIVAVSVPMLNATETMKAHPKVQPKAVDKMIARGTATFAFLTSSLMWTLESVPPTTHAGAKKERMNARPLGQSVKFSKVPNTKLAEFLNSGGVATGRAIINPTKIRIFKVMYAT